MESSSQVPHFEVLRARLLVEYGEFLKASRTGGADGVDPDTGKLDGKYRFAGYTAIGSAYAPDNGILFVSLDIGADPGPRRPEDLVCRGGEKRMADESPSQRNASAGSASSARDRVSRVPRQGEGSGAYGE